MIATPAPGREPPAGVYVHVPFCASRCGYCDFAAVAGRDGAIPAYLDALEIEIGSFQREAPRAADTVFVGGGTPSRLPGREIGRLLAAVRDRFAVAAGAEVTVEGNPESLTPGRLEDLALAGVTRVCVGVQSLDDSVLRRAGRPHDARRHPLRRDGARDRLPTRQEHAGAGHGPHRDRGSRLPAGPPARRPLRGA